jgi:hypothetical protein
MRTTAVALPISHSSGGAPSVDEVVIPAEAIPCRKPSRRRLRRSPSDLVQERRNVGG